MPDPLPTSLEPQALLDLYRKTHYDVRLPGGLRSTVRIGQAVPAALADRSGAHWNAFVVTACNPLSALLTAMDNRERMRNLLLLAKPECRQCLPGVGHIPGRTWRESCLLLAGTRVDFIDGIARQFAQNAVVSLQANQAARLRVYQTDWREAVQDSADIEWA